MRIRTTILAGAFLLACSGAAVAQDTERTKSGFYLGLGVGKSKATLNNSDFSVNGTAATNIGGLPTTESKDETDTGYKAMAGWRINRFLALELAYADLGRFTYNYTFDLFSFGIADRTSRITYKATSWTGSVLGTIPVSGALSGLVRLGLTSNRVERSTVEGGVIFTAPGYSTAMKRRTSALWGLGGQYDLGQHTALRLEFENYGRFGEARTSSPNFFPTETGQAKIWMWSLSGIYVF